MTEINWEFLKENFTEIIEEINPANYDTDILIYAKDEEELKREANSILKSTGIDNEFIESTEFAFDGEGYYAYNIMYNEFNRIDYILKGEINSAIYAMQDFPDSYWADFVVTSTMQKVLDHINSVE